MARKDSGMQENDDPSVLYSLFVDIKYKNDA